LLMTGWGVIMVHGIIEDSDVCGVPGCVK